LRLAGVMLGLEILLWACRSHVVAGLQTFAYLMLAIAGGLLWGAIMWVLYLAIEPWIRGNWPHAIISWSRLVSGHLRDAAVGRDILFGTAFGAAWILIFEVGFIPLARMGAAPQLHSTVYLLGARDALGRILWQLPFSILGTLQFFFLLFVLKVLLEFIFRQIHLKVARTEWIAAVLFVVIMVGLRWFQLPHRAVQVPVLVAIFGLLAVVVLRFGLVPLVVGAFSIDMFLNVPFTTDFSVWYAGNTLLALLVLVGLASWGFYHSLGREPLWKAENAD
jgi:hypothetical protein